MRKAKIAITVRPHVLSRLDVWVPNEHYASRNEAIEQAVKDQLQLLERIYLAARCTFPDADEEQAMADSSFAANTAACATL